MTDQHLTITRGLPGSGKTRVAREWVEGQPLGARVNRDDLRLMMYGRAAGLADEQETAVNAAEHAVVAALLTEGRSVIVDAMHLRLAYARHWADVAAATGASFGVIDLDTPLGECIARDARRDGDARVGWERITELAEKFHKRLPVTPTTPRDEWAPEPYLPDESLPDAWIVDIDGTLAHNDGHRGWFDWSKVGADAPIENVIRLATALYDANYSIVLMSGREEAAREDTEAWLSEHTGFEFAELHMRQDGDERGDDIVKAELFDKHVRYRWNVRGVVDDRPKVCRMWRTMGMTVAQVGDPHVEF